MQVVENPIAQYSEDGGQHPSRAETERLIRFIDEKTKEIFQTPYLLPSATQDTLTTSTFYAKVTGLYKYGCSGCNAKTKNRWFNLCNDCRTTLQEDENILKLVDEFEDRVDKFMDANNPELKRVGNESPETLGCPQCNAEFKNGEEIRQHFKDKHPEVTVVDRSDDLRKKHKFGQHDSRNRRDKVFKPL